LPPKPLFPFVGIQCVSGIYYLHLQPLVEECHAICQVLPISTI